MTVFMCGSLLITDHWQKNQKCSKFALYIALINGVSVNVSNTFKPVANATGQLLYSKLSMRSKVSVSVTVSDIH